MTNETWAALALTWLVAAIVVAVVIVRGREPKPKECPYCRRSSWNGVNHCPLCGP